MSTKSKITISGAPEGFDAELILQELDKSGQPVCHVARDDKRMVAMQDALRIFFTRPSCHRLSGLGLPAL